MIELIILFLIIQINLYGYIDPGTGSLLFSALFGIVGTLFFLFKSLFIKIKNISFHKNNRINNYSSRLIIYGEDKRYFNVFKPIIEQLIKLKIPTIYYSSSKDDKIFDIKSEFLYTEFIGEGIKAYAKLNFIEADICLMTTPNLDVFHLKRSKGVKKYIHIVHSPVIPLYKLYSLDFFDSVLINGSHQEEYIRALEELRGEKPKEICIVGSTYLDELENNKRLFCSDFLDGEDILLSPSWGNNALLSRYGSKIIDALLTTGRKIIIRPHPQSMISEKNMIEKLKKHYVDNINIEWDFKVDNLPSFRRAKIMVSDFSGVIFDFIFLFEKPVLLPEFTFDKSIYDCSMLKDEIWTFKALDKIGFKIKEGDFADMRSIINKTVNNTEVIENIRNIKKEAYLYQGESSYRTALFLKEGLEKINNSSEVKV